MEGMIKRIMVYVDGTERAITAAQYGICLAKTLHAELYAVYVVNTRALNELVRAKIFLESEQEEYQQDLETDAEKYLRHVQELAREKNIKIETIRASGNIHVEIKRKVEEYDIDILLLGELSQVRSRRDEFYDETERTMRSVSCSVMIVKDEDKVWELFESL